MNEEEVFIWTEAFNCGEILNPMLSSYLKHNKSLIHVFGTEKDFQEVSFESKLVKFEKLDTKRRFRTVESKILKGYKNGHKGTAILWEYIINSRPEKIFIHLDSDTIFLGEVISDLIKATMIEGYAIVGSRRAYKNRGYRKEGKDGQLLDLRPDVVNTDCFAFNKKFIKKFPRFWLRRKIHGRRVSTKPVVDFFDPVTFEIIKKGGLIKYIDSPNSGFHSVINYNSRFMEARISFAAVGSGCNFFKNGHEGVPGGYWGYALASYSLFAREFLNKDIGVEPLNDEILKGKIAKLDKVNWILKQD